MKLIVTFCGIFFFCSSINVASGSLRTRSLSPRGRRQSNKSTSQGDKHVTERVHHPKEEQPSKFCSAQTDHLSCTSSATEAIESSDRNRRLTEMDLPPFIMYRLGQLWKRMWSFSTPELLPLLEDYLYDQRRLLDLVSRLTKMCEDLKKTPWRCVKSREEYTINVWQQTTPIETYPTNLTLAAGRRAVVIPLAISYKDLDKSGIITSHFMDYSEPRQTMCFPTPANDCGYFVMVLKYNYSRRDVENEKSVLIDLSTYGIRIGKHAFTPFPIPISVPEVEAYLPRNSQLMEYIHGITLSDMPLYLTYLQTAPKGYLGPRPHVAVEKIIFRLAYIYNIVMIALNCNNIHHGDVVNANVIFELPTSSRTFGLLDFNLHSVRIIDLETAEVNPMADRSMPPQARFDGPIQWLWYDSKRTLINILDSMRDDEKFANAYDDVFSAKSEQDGAVDMSWDEQLKEISESCSFLTTWSNEKAEYKDTLVDLPTCKDARSATMFKVPRRLAKYHKNLASSLLKS